MFCSLAGLYDESGGVGVPWPDYQSMFILSSAVLSLGLYALHARVRWLMLTGTFVTLATLARDTGGCVRGHRLRPDSGMAARERCAKGLWMARRGRPPRGVRDPGAPSDDSACSAG